MGTTKIICMFIFILYYSVIAVQAALKNTEKNTLHIEAQQADVMAKLAPEISKNKILHFDDAVALTGFGRFNLFVLLATGGCLMCVIMETMGMMFIIPAAECDLELNLTMKGYLSAASFLGVVSGSHLWGFLGDTRGRKKIILISMITSAIITLISSIVPEDWLFILLRFLNGLFVGGSSGIVYAYAGEFHDNIYRPKVVSWLATFVAFGNMALPGLAWLILPAQWAIELPLLGILFRPWRLLVIAYGLPSLFFALCIACIPESPKYLLTQGKNSEVLDILKNIFAINTGKSAEEFPVSKIIWDEDTCTNSKNESFMISMWKQTVPLFKKPLALKTFMVCTLQFGAFVSTSGLAMWYPEILNRMATFEKENPGEDITACIAIHYHTGKEELHINDTVSESPHCTDSIESEVFTIGIVIGSFLAVVYIAVGGLINILGKKNILIGFFTISSVAGLTAQYISGSGTVKTLMGLVLISSTSIGVINAVVVDIYPTQLRGMALAISLMFGRIGAVTGSHITGLIFYQLCDYTFHIFTADNFILIILVLLLPASPHIPKMIETIT